jgi:8-oxo-dGTP pyrophosphatase MutT (NUDIX family)
MRLPVSVKGILIHRRRVLVLRNDRGEWELPGGRLDDGETPEEALRREILEETGLRVTVGSLVDAWVFQVTPREKVLILQYACRLSDRRWQHACRANGKGGVRISHEHSGSIWLPVTDLNREPLPRGYLRGIQRALAPSTVRTSR